MKGLEQSQNRNILRKQVNYRPEIFRMLRKNISLTQKELAKKINISEETICNLECGNCPSPQFNTLFEMTEFYNVPICYITLNQTKKHSINKLIKHSLEIDPDHFFSILKSNNPIDKKRVSFISFACNVTEKLISEIFNIHDVIKKSN